MATGQPTRSTQLFRRIGLPILGVAETIATGGKSPGTTAQRQEQIFQQADAQRLAEAQQREQALGRKLQREFQELQIEELKGQRGKEKQKLATEEARQKAIKSRLLQIPDLTEAERAGVEAGFGEEVIKQRIKPEKPGFGEEFAKTMALFKAKETFKRDQPKPPRELSAKQIDGITGADDSISILEDIEQAFKPEFVGPAAGRFGSIKELIGFSGESEAIFRTNVEAFKNELLKARSGGAVTPSEAARLEREVSNVNLKPKIFIARLKRNIQFLKGKRKRFLSNLKKGNFNIGGFEVASTPSGTPPPTDSGPPPGMSQEDFDALSPAGKALIRGQ